MILKVKTGKEAKNQEDGSPIIVHKYITVDQRRRPERTVLLLETEIEESGSDFNGVFSINETAREKDKKGIKG